MHISKLVTKIPKRILEECHRKLFYSRFISVSGCKDISFLSSNCVGTRLSQLCRQRYNSPTVDLWFKPNDYLNFVERLDEYLNATLSEDFDESISYGYPVGILQSHRSTEPVKIYFQHFENFELASAAWYRRVERVQKNKIVLTFTDRDGATLDDLRRFDAFPFPKIVFTARYYSDIKSSCYVPFYKAGDFVGDLYSEWINLTRVLSKEKIGSFAGQL